MTYLPELVDGFLGTLRSYEGSWLVVRNSPSREMTLDAGRGTFWEQADVSLTPGPKFSQRDSADFLLTTMVEGRTTMFVGKTVKYLSPGYVPELAERLRQLAAAAHASGKSLELPHLLVLVGYMSQRTREELHNRNLSFYDSSRSMYLRGENFLVAATGRDFPAQFQRAGGGTLRLDSPKVSRVVRACLAGHSGGVREMAAEIGVDPGYVSKLLQSLASTGFLRRKHEGSILNVKYSLEAEMRGELLNAWASSPRVLWRKRELYQVPFPEPSELEERLTEVCRSGGRRHAFTLWGAANKFKELTTNPMVALYCDDAWNLKLDELKAQPADRFANLWLLTPRDEGVFQFTQEVSGLEVVHPVQLYYDLVHAPHRGKAVAEMFREKFLGY